MLYEMLTGRPPFLGDSTRWRSFRSTSTRRRSRRRWHNPDGASGARSADFYRCFAKAPGRSAQTGGHGPRDAGGARLRVRRRRAAPRRTPTRRIRSIGWPAECSSAANSEMGELRAGFEEALLGRGRSADAGRRGRVSARRAPLERARHATPGCAEAQVLRGRCYAGGGGAGAVGRGCRSSAPIVHDERPDDAAGGDGLRGRQTSRSSSRDVRERVAGAPVGPQPLRTGAGAFPSVRQHGDAFSATHRDRPAHHPHARRSPVGRQILARCCFGSSSECSVDRRLRCMARPGRTRRHRRSSTSSLIRRARRSCSAGALSGRSPASSSCWRAGRPPQASSAPSARADRRSTVLRRRTGACLRRGRRA